jgi:hypothetical protein
MTAPAISETNSEKPKRGRPRLLPPELADVYANGRKDIHPRSIQNRHYELRAFELLFMAGNEADRETAQERYRWLCNVDEQHSRHKAMRSAVLAELGRFDDPAAIRAYAAQLCALKPKAREAVLMLRQRRTGGTRPGSANQLTGEIIEAVTRYRQRHPDSTYELVRDALDNARAVADLLNPSTLPA